MRTRLVGAAAFFLIVATATGWVAPLAAQSLAAVAKQEEERRKAIRQPSKVLTNKDLKPVPAAPQPVEGAAPATNAAAAAKDTSTDAAARPGTPASGAPGSKAEPVVKDQAYWASLLQAIQSQLSRDQIYADALQTRINSLSADFVNRDDPAQRAVIAADREKALTELDRLNQQILADKKAVTDFMEDARRAGVPPGWLR